jgi:quercetin dioxygenase-like cupin family protein
MHIARPTASGFAVLMLAALPATMLPAAAPEPPRVTVEFDQPLPNIPGKSLRVVRVEYAPGGTSPAHTHASSAFIHARVLKGAIRSAVNDQPARVYREGESFNENPGDRHSLSENASAVEPAVLLATFVVNTSETVLTLPAAKP